MNGDHDDACEILDILLEGDACPPLPHEFPKTPFKDEPAAATSRTRSLKRPLETTLPATADSSAERAPHDISWPSLLRGELETFLSGKEQRRPVLLQSVCSGMASEVYGLKDVVLFHIGVALGP